jgi:uncharacterized protein (TIGR02246 family)
MNNDQEQIRMVFEEVYPANVRGRDLERFAEMYTNEALRMPPDQADRRGIPDIVEGFAAQIANQNIDPTFIAEEIEVRGDVGYVIGTTHATVYPHDGSASKEIKFQGLWLMKKEGDIWKIDRQIWNVKPN